MKLRDDIRYAAVLLDGDNQLLSTGETWLRPEKTDGVFWPNTPANEDLILKSAKILKVVGKASLRILKIDVHHGEAAPPYFQAGLDFDAIQHKASHFPPLSN
jgi:hypothetical protein